MQKKCEMMALPYSRENTWRMMEGSEGRRRAESGREERGVDKARKVQS